ncbi:MAG TPA: hypothetical protein VNM87_00090 [Candidatus Udaeobacter sp.]|nr:hypothetical protein [Candidatus Udaeobacter sp.]
MLADLDVAGNVTDGTPGNGPNAPDGGLCGTCPAPAGDTGVDFKNGDLYVLAGGQIHHLVNCAIVGSTTVQGITVPFGLGYDSLRDLWIVTDPGADRVYQVNMAGAVVNSWPAPAAGAVGAAYDSNRDLYLIADFTVDQITRLNPNTGLPAAPIPVPAGSRIAGTGFDPGADLIMYNGRDQATTYCISAATGVLVFSQPIPAGGGNNGQGAGIAPDGNGWLSHFEQPTLYCVEKDVATAVEQTTWGAIKSVYE